MRLAAPLIAASLALPPLATPAQTLDPAMQEAVDARIRSYLLENPEVLLEVFEVLEMRRRAAEAEADADLVAEHADALFDDGFSFAIGAAQADVTIAMFSDYRCGYCKAAHGALTTLMAEDPGVRLVVQEFPVLGPASVVAARAAIAAGRMDPSLYAPFFDALMTFRGQIDEAAVFATADDLGIDEAALRAAMEAPEIEAGLRATFDLARKLDVNGTPTFVIGDSVVRGFVQLDALRGLVAAAREDRG